MLMAKVVSDLANRTPGKEAVAMESFAKALRMVRHVRSADIWMFREDQCSDAVEGVGYQKMKITA